MTDAATQILNTYRDLARQPGDLVSLTHIRQYTDLDDATLTAVLKGLDRSRVIALEPETNRKALTGTEFAVKVGCEMQHNMYEL
jgi:hypothetical protein